MRFDECETPEQEGWLSIFRNLIDELFDRQRLLILVLWKQDHPEMFQAIRYESIPKIEEAETYLNEFQDLFEDWIIRNPFPKGNQIPPSTVEEVGERS